MSYLSPIAQNEEGIECFIISLEGDLAYLTEILRPVFEICEGYRSGMQYYCGLQDNKYT